MLAEPLLDVFVPGDPASFATRGERPWKATLESVLSPTPVLEGARCLSLDFHVSPRAGFASGADIDNLCEPVLSVLVNRVGWFARRRPTISALRARKAIATPAGCRIVATAGAWPEDWVAGALLFDGTTDRPLPTSARDVAFAAWVAAEALERSLPAATFGVAIEIAQAINIGDVATGRVKNIIDCLYPVLGGRIGAPADDRVAVLEVRHSVPMTGTVRVRVVDLTPA